MFDLTSEEQKVVVFLVSIALLGSGINFLAKKFTAAKTFPSFSEDIFKLDLNKADKKSLLEIPGIGQALAERILDYRRSNGAFKNKEELKQIRGITSYRYNRLKEYFR